MLRKFAVNVASGYFSSKFLSRLNAMAVTACYLSRYINPKVEILKLILVQHLCLIPLRTIWTL